MSTWVLVFYMSSGFGTGATGGPATVDGFTSEATCNAFGAKLNAKFGSKFDWFVCVKADK